MCCCRSSPGSRSSLSRPGCCYRGAIDPCRPHPPHLPRLPHLPHLPHLQRERPVGSPAADGRDDRRHRCDVRCPRHRARPTWRRLRARAQPDLHEPSAARGLSRRGRRDRRAVLHLRPRPRRPGRAPGPDRPRPPAAGRHPARPARRRALGWSWIVAPGPPRRRRAPAEVATLFLWVYGWVGLASLSAFVGPVWHFLDPFSTLHDLGAALLRRLGVQPLGQSPTTRPGSGAGRRSIGFLVVVWLELVARGRPARPVRRRSSATPR